MYLRHFGLTEYPFGLTPDTSFYYAYPGHQEAINVLSIALLTDQGFVKVTGEVGTGKTLLCRKLLNSMDQNAVTAWLPNPQMDARSLRRAVAEELGLKDLEQDDHRLLKSLAERLIEHHSHGRRVILAIDEAQNLTEEGFEALRLLTNLETEKSKLLQIVLFGQPELDRKLQRPALRQLNQRITFSHQLKPLHPDAVGDYVMHRLRKAGYNGPALLPYRSVRLLAQGSRGIPRLINILAHKAMMSAFGKGERILYPRHVLRAIHDTEAATPPRWGGWFG